MSKTFVDESIKIKNPFENASWEEETIDLADTLEAEEDFDFLSERIKTINALQNVEDQNKGANFGIITTKGLNTNRFVQIKSKTYSQTLMQNYHKQSTLSPTNTKFQNSKSFPIMDTQEEENNCNNFQNSSKISEESIEEDDFWNLMFAPQFDEQVQREHFLLTYKSLYYATKQLKGPSDSYLKKMQIVFPKLTKPAVKTLLLDLDETLVTCMPLSKHPQHIINSSIGISIRPYVPQLLQKLSLYYELYIFTASSSPYANIVRNLLDPKNQYFQGILTREHCLETKQGAWIKDLRVIKNRELSNMIIVDNLAHSFAFQIDNGVPISSWKGDKTDQELIYLTNYLIELAKSDNLPKANNKKLRLKYSAEVFMKKYSNETN